MPTDSLDQYHAALALLDRLPSEILALGNAYQGLPVPGSQAEREQTALPNLQAPSAAFVIASQLLVAADDNLVALRRTLTEPSLSLAPWGLARSVLELSSIAAWLLAPDLTAMERARRALNARVEEVRRYNEYIKDIAPNSPSDIKLVEDSLELLNDSIGAIVQQAEGLGFKVRCDGADLPRSVGGAGMPGTTALTQDIFGQRAEWRLLSGAEHGRTWALRGLGMRVASQESASLASLTAQSLPPERRMWLTIQPLAVFTRVAWNRAAFAGWPLLPLTTLLREAAHTLGRDSSHHFWADARTSGGTTALRDLTLSPRGVNGS